MKSWLRTTLFTSTFGCLLGLVAAGVWAADQPDMPDEVYYLDEPFGFMPGDIQDQPTFTGAGFWDFAPVPANRLPVSLWLALPLTTTAVGAAVGVGASAAGVRISRG